MGTKLKSIIALLFIVTGLALATGCSPSSEPPAVFSASRPVDFPACRSASLSLKTLHADNFKALIDCMNGPNQDLAPYKDLLDSTDPKDLEAILNIVNLHILNNPARLNQFFSLVDKMHSNHQLASMMKDFSVIIESKSALNLIPILKTISNSKDTDVQSLRSFLLDLLSSKEVSRAIIALADHFGSLNGKALAYLISKENPNAVINSEGVMDLLSRETLNSINDGTLHSLIQTFTDSKMNPATLLSPLGDDELTDLSDLLSFLPKGASSGKQTELEQCQDAVRHEDIPLVCYQHGSRAYRTDSILWSVVEEAVKRPRGPESEAFFLKTLPLYYSETVGSCDYGSYSLKDIEVEEKVSRAGFANGKRALLKALSGGDSREKEASFLKSELVRKLQPLLEEVGSRGGVNVAVRLFARDVSATDVQSISEILKSFEKTKSEETLNNLLRSIFANDAQKKTDLSRFVHSFVVSLGDTRGGWGDLISVLAQATSLSESTPVQDTVTELLQDQALTNSLIPIFKKTLDNPRLPALLDFTAKLSESGQLERILQFLADVLKHGGMEGLPGPAMAQGYIKNNTEPISYAQNYSSVSRQSQSLTLYSTCTDLRGSIFEATGATLNSVLQCASLDPKYLSLSKISKDLSDKGLLPLAAHVLGTPLTRTAFMSGALDELSILQQSGDLKTLFDLYAWAMASPYNLNTKLGPVFKDAFLNSGLPGTLKLLGSLVSSDSAGPATTTALNILNQPAQKFFSSQAQFRLKVKDPEGFKKSIAGWYPNLNPSQVESVYQNARENFETHNDTWKYKEGSYNYFSETEWRNEVYIFAENFLRSNDLAEFILALQSIGKNLPIAQFLSKAIDEQKITLHYSNDGRTTPHIMTLWDQLEELVQDANFEYTPMLPYIDVTFHVGINFQLAVVKSNNLARDMEMQNLLVRSGIEFANFRGQIPEKVHFQNMLSNYDGLMEIAHDGNLRVFQTLYTALYRSTPPEIRNARTLVNHMGNLFHMNNVAFFANSTMALASAKSQGQLETIVNGLFNLMQVINPEDIEPLRQSFLAMLTRAKIGDLSPFESLIEKIVQIQNNPEGYKNLKDSLFHLVPAAQRINISTSGVFKSLPILLRNTENWNYIVDQALSDLQKSDGTSMRLASNILRLKEDKVKALRQMGQIVLKNDPQGADALPSLTLLLTDLYTAHPHEISSTYEALKSYLQDERVKAIDLNALVSKIVKEINPYRSGLGDLTGDILKDPIELKNLITLARGLAQKDDIVPMTQLMGDLTSSGDLNETLHFLFDNLYPSSLTSGTWTRNYLH